MEIGDPAALGKRAIVGARIRLNNDFVGEEEKSGPKPLGTRTRGGVRDVTGCWWDASMRSERKVVLLGRGGRELSGLQSYLEAVKVPRLRRAQL